MFKVRPSNLFLRPLGLFFVIKKSNISKTKLVKKLYTLILDKHQKDQIFFCFAEIVTFKAEILNSAARDQNKFLKMAREQKSLATPAV